MKHRTETSQPPYLLTEVTAPHQFALARILFLEYAEQLGVDLRFQGFSLELERLADMYGPPTGCLVLVTRGATAVGCGAIRRLTAAACEMKRLYVRDAERGANVGRRIAEYLVRRARALGYERMLLDTLEEMAAARRLYGSLGFRETSPYYDNPLKNAVYLALDLGRAER